MFLESVLAMTAAIWLTYSLMFAVFFLIMLQSPHFRAHMNRSNPSYSSCILATVLGPIGIAIAAAHALRHMSGE